MVVGDMLELGEHTMKLHIELGNALANSLFDGIYLFGEYGIYTKMGLESAGYNMSCVYLFDDIQNYEGLLCALSKELKPGDVCLLKGSNASRMWRITEGLDEGYSSCKSYIYPFLSFHFYFLFLFFSCYCHALRNWRSNQFIKKDRSGI